MNRRRFLQLGTVGLVAATAVAVLPKIVASLPPVLNPEIPATTYSTYVMGANAMPALTLAELRECVKQLKSTRVQANALGNYIGPVHPDWFLNNEDWLPKAVAYKWKYRWNVAAS